MSIAADARYRSVRLAFNNNDARGNENVQLYAKASGGDWALARTFAVAGDEQVTSWDTAIPMTAYGIAMRYVSGNVPAVGYEGTPDDWTASTAAGSKSTVTTTSAPVTWGSAPAFVDAATPITLSWSSDQQGVPYLLEKDVGAGFVTVVADLVATSYQYTIPSGELGDTVDFRVTAKRGSVAGPTAGVLSVDMFVTVGTTAFTTSTFSPTTRITSLAWSAATNALNYLLEKSLDAGANYSTIGTIGGTSYSYAVPDAEINTTVRFRVRGQNGAIQGATAIANVAMTVVVGSSTLTVSSAFNAITGAVSFSWTTASSATAYDLQYNTGAGWVLLSTYSTTGPVTRQLGADLSAAWVNTTVSFRIIPTNGSVNGTAANTPSVAFTVSLPTAPAGLTAVQSGSQILVSFSASTGDVWGYAVYMRRSGGGFGLQGFLVAPQVSGLLADLSYAGGECYVIATACNGYIAGGTSSTVAIT